MTKTTKFPLINLIVAFSKNYGIGRSNAIPWKIKEDMFYFQDVTKREYIKGKQNAVIYGRKTYEGLGQPLKDRINIMISSKTYDFKNIVTVKTLQHAITAARDMDIGKIFICGGASVYKEALDTNMVDELYINRIEEDYNCDIKFPVESLDKYRL